MIIKQSFFDDDTIAIAKKLLGCYLCRRKENGEILRGKIVETEAYTQDDPASHSFCGITKRSITMYQKAGIAYVYMTYGMYHCINVVTEKKGVGCAVLIRALEPVNENINLKTKGSGLLCKAFEINKTLNGIDLLDEKSPLWLECSDKTIEENEIVATTRIGIKKASDYPWRFYIRNNKFISKK